MYRIFEISIKILENYMKKYMESEQPYWRIIKRIIYYPDIREHQYRWYENRYVGEKWISDPIMMKFNRLNQTDSEWVALQ